MGDAIKSDAYKQWLQIRDSILCSTSINPNETKAEQRKRIDRARKDYNFFVQYYFPHYCIDQATGTPVPCAPFHIKAANDIRANRTLKAVFKWARGHAKSTHMDIFIPMWLKYAVHFQRFHDDDRAPAKQKSKLQLQLYQSRSVFRLC